MANDAVVSAKLSRADARIFNASVDRMGMVKKELLGRMIRWFSAQDKLVQTMIAGQIPEKYEEEIITLLYERKKLAAEKVVQAAGKRRSAPQHPPAG